MQKPGKKSEILIIESDVETARQLSKSFLRLGYPCHIASTGEDGIRYIETEASPVVFLDSELPGISGVEVLNILYSIQPMCQVIFILGEQDLRDIMSGITGRIPNFLFKPLTDELTEIAVRKAEQNYFLEKEKGMYLESLERDLRIAARIQKQLTRQENVEMDRLLFGAITRAGRGYLNGNFSSFFKLNDQELLIVMGDISGTGVTASLIAREVQWLAEMYYRTNPDPARLLRNVNDTLIEKLGSCSLSVLAGVVDTERRLFEYCSCGMPMPVLIRHDGSHQFLSQGNQVIGVLKNIELGSTSVNLLSGDIIFLFTKGLLELGMGQQGGGAMDDAFETVHQNIYPVSNQEDFQQEFQKLVHRFENVHLREGFKDDIAMAVVKYHPQL